MMSESYSVSHTPGPWFYRRGDEWSHSVVTHHGVLPDGSPSCWSIADINKRREPEHEANARLIAAAPDFWTAHETARDAILNCRGALEGEGLSSEQVNAVLAEFDDAFATAIAKATGDSAIASATGARK